MIKKRVIIVLFGMLLTNCTAVKPYQKMYLNDENMMLSSRKIEQYEISSQNYREGVSGANGSKAGGGCGCN